MSFKAPLDSMLQRRVRGPGWEIFVSWNSTCPSIDLGFVSSLDFVEPRELLPPETVTPDYCILRLVGTFPRLKMFVTSTSFLFFLLEGPALLLLWLDNNFLPPSSLSRYKCANEGAPPGGCLLSLSILVGISLCPRFCLTGPNDGYFLWA